MRRTGNFQRTIDARHTMIKQGMLIVWPPSRTSHVVNFDLHRLLDAIDDARHADLFLFRRRRARLCLWLLWHLRSPNKYVVSTGSGSDRVCFALSLRNPASATRSLPLPVLTSHPDLKLHSRPRLRGRQRSFKNSRISSAAAEISLARFANFIERRVRILLKVSRDRSHEPWGAKSAHRSI